MSSQELLAAAGGRVNWRDVLRCLDSDGARSLTLATYRSAGFGPDDFERSRRAREAMADALTRTEDQLGAFSGGRRSSRADQSSLIRTVRRRLEWELWP